MWNRVVVINYKKINLRQSQLLPFLVTQFQFQSNYFSNSNYNIIDINYTVIEYTFHA